MSALVEELSSKALSLSNRGASSTVYLERRDEVYILALAPFSRKPGYWRSRRNEG